MRWMIPLLLLAGSSLNGQTQSQSTDKTDQLQALADLIQSVQALSEEVKELRSELRELQKTVDLAGRRNSLKMSMLKTSLSQKIEEAHVKDYGAKPCL